MKVLHIIGGNLDEGAAKGALFLHDALVDRGVDSRVFTNSSVSINSDRIESSSESRYGDYKSKVIRFADRIPEKFYPRKRQLVFDSNIFGLDIRKSKSYNSSDIIHLHWVNAGVMRLNYLADIKKPIVWTLRDMWPMTGGCHYALDCERYKKRCGKCIQLNSKREIDLSRLNFFRKQQYFPESLNIVGVSGWISSCAKQSGLLGHYNICTIHNGIDTQMFRPIDKVKARDQLGLPQNKKILLVGAQGIGSPFKGFSYFEEAVKIIVADFYVVIFGRDAATVLDRLPFPAKQFGFLDSIKELQQVYAAADVFVAPSEVESFGKTIAEALACGTPVVCFDVSGQRDNVDHKVTGFKANPFDTVDLARGIDWVVEDDERHKNLSLMARQSAENLFDIKLTAERYHKLYESLA